jgi:hypothetical protein
MGIFQSKENNNNLLEHIRETVFMKNYAWEIYDKMVKSDRIRKNLRETLNICIDFAERMKYYEPELTHFKVFNTERELPELKVHDFAIFEYSQLFENFAKTVRENIKMLLIIYYFEKDTEFNLFDGYNCLFESHKSREYINNFSFIGKDEIFLKKFIEKCNQKLSINPFYTYPQNGGTVVNDTIREKMRTIESLRKFDIPDELFQVESAQKPIKASCNLEEICIFYKLLNIPKMDCLFLEISFGIIFDWGRYSDYFRILKKYYPEMFEGTWSMPFKKRFEHIIKLNLKMSNFNLKGIDYSNIHLFDTRPQNQEYYKIIRQKGEAALLKSKSN